MSGCKTQTAANRTVSAAISRLLYDCRNKTKCCKPLKYSHTGQQRLSYLSLPGVRQCCSAAVLQFWMSAHHQRLPWWFPCPTYLLARCASHSAMPYRDRDGRADRQTPVTRPVCIHPSAQHHLLVLQPSGARYITVKTLYYKACTSGQQQQQAPTSAHGTRCDTSPVAHPHASVSAVPSFGVRNPPASLSSLRHLSHS